MTTTCHVCGAPTDANLCRSHADELDTAFTDLAGLIEAVAGKAAQQARTYRSSMKPAQVDEDWRGSPFALVRTPWVVDLDAADVLHRARNELVTTARDLAERRGLTVIALDGDLEGPACAGHEHDFEPEGCGHHPEQCKQLHPGHVHSMKPRGCGLNVDPDTGEMRCRQLHCDHASCDAIRHGARPSSTAALIRWLLGARDSIRYDEAALEIFTAITTLRNDLQRAVDRRPSRIDAGPCESRISGRKCDRRLYAKVSPWLVDDDGQRTAVTIVCDGWRPDGRLPGDDGCGAEHTAHDRVEWLLASIDDALAPLDVWRAALPKMLDHLTWPHRAWWSRLGDIDNNRRVLLARTVIDGVELFRGGDIVDYIEREQPRIVGNIERAKRQAARMSA